MESKIVNLKDFKNISEHTNGEMDNHPGGSKRDLLMIVGPCSAESEAQLRTTAELIQRSEVPVSFFRAGVWKPRSQPGNFEGAGDPALEWLKNIRDEFSFPLITEVANARHAELVLEAGFDAVWIGARTTVNPFYVQEIADVLKGVDLPVFVKNPVSPDLNLWLGAIERIEEQTNGPVYPIHRGFSVTGNSRFRNRPVWQIPIELKTRRPDLNLICDPSHIAGRRDYIKEVAQKSLDLNFGGLMVETHHNPDVALSDAGQQVEPFTLREIFRELRFRDYVELTDEKAEALSSFREQIDKLDGRLLELLAERMEISSKIGEWKHDNSVSVLQPERWSFILKRAQSRGGDMGLSKEFMDQLFKAIHDESIDRQTTLPRHFGAKKNRF